MPIYDRKDLGPIPTVPLNLDQGPRFAALSETAKDAIITELTKFFSEDNNKLRIGEIPRINKYAVSVDVNVDPLETAVSIIRSNPDIVEDMPLVAVMASTGQNSKFDISNKSVGVVVPTAKLICGTGPFSLVDGDTIRISTCPYGRIYRDENRQLGYRIGTAGTDTFGIVGRYKDNLGVVESEFIFRSFMFSDMSSIPIDEMVEAINKQALYLNASNSLTGGENRLVLHAGGPKGTEFPNRIEVISGEAVPKLSLVIGQSDQNYGQDKIAYERCYIAADLTISLQVVAESDNVRTELSDLVYDFFTFSMADRQFQLFGRSVFTEDVANETYQIILKDATVGLTGEQELPRPGDPRDKIYISSINVPITIIQYVDRVITYKSGDVVRPSVGVDTVPNYEIPLPN